MRMKIIDFLSMAEFTSAFDNTKRELLLALPMAFNVKKTYNIVISPHPFGFSHFENYSGGPPTMTEPYIGWKGLASKFDCIIACPFGHGRVNDRASLAYEGQIEDLADMDKILKKNGFNINKMYAIGLSMGAMEVLTLIGRHPGKIAAAFSFNGLADLEGWYDDIVNKKTDKRLLDMMVDQRIVEEVGARPDEAREAYLKRSPISYVENISKTPLMLYWSSKDDLAANQQTTQTKKLYDMIKQYDPDAMVFAYDHSADHAFRDQEGVRSHEYCDYEKALEWVLEF
jgi:predicted peptidase